MNQLPAILGFLMGFLLTAHPAAARTCRIVFPERPQSAPKVAFLYDGKKNHAVTLPSMNLSEVVKLPKGELTIALTLTEITDSEAVPSNLPMLRIPEHVTDFYIILLPDGKNKDLPVRMNMVDTGEGKLKPGETLWYNFTGHRIIARLGRADMSVDPLGKTISRDPIETSGYYVAQFKYQADGKAPIAPITEQSWWHDAKSRHIGFIASTGGKLPKIYFFRDFRMPEDPEGNRAAETEPEVP
ncbi:MAG: hypothetical protein RL346_2182 [Verrucomicrobiota bacterium]|jgi:hypothetical protein